MAILTNINENTIINVGDQIYYWTVLQVNPRGSYLCRCQCGTERVIKRSVLIKGDSKSCGCMYHVKDISNQTFGELKAIKYIGDKKWLCECSCGKMIEVPSYNLSHGLTTSCGHNKLPGKVIDLRDQKFGELTPIEYKGNSMWLCKCSCGKETIVHRYSLQTGATRSCGHLSHNRDKLEGMKIGSLFVEEYLGNKHYKCKCDCGNIVVVWAANLKNGNTNSCGCKTKQLMYDTLMKRYGENNSFRINNPRENWQIEVFNDKNKLSIFMSEYTKLVNRKVTFTEVGNILDVSRDAVKIKLTQFNLLSYIDDTIGKSDDEIEMYNYINKLCSKYGYSIQDSNRTILNGKEIDIYIPELKIGFEYNGSYWHSDEYKNIKYHLNKSILASNKGIRLIHIFDYEWINQKDKMELFIDDVLNNNKNRVYARECKIKVADNNEVQEFLEKYHIQGAVKSLINLALYKDNIILGVMSFSKPRFSPEYEYEITRICWRHGYIIVGGSKKLFDYFINNYNPSSIVSYSDISKFRGTIYNDLGMKFKTITDPNYKWVNTYNNSVLSRYQTTKQKLIDKGLGSENETEDIIMKRLNFHKVYDCGNQKFIWNK